MTYHRSTWILQLHILVVMKLLFDIYAYTSCFFFCFFARSSVFLTSRSIPCRWGSFISTHPLTHRVSGSHMWSVGPRDPTQPCLNSQRKFIYASGYSSSHASSHPYGNSSYLVLCPGLHLSLSMCELCNFLSQDVLLQKALTASCMAGETLKVLFCSISLRYSNIVELLVSILFLGKFSILKPEKSLSNN